MLLNNRTDLDARVAYLRTVRTRGLAFCIGSALTAPLVPDVRRAVAAMVASLGADGSELEAVLKGAVDGAAYQRAASFILARRGQDWLNTVVRGLVLNAHRPTLDAQASGDIIDDDFTEQYCAAAEASLGDWYIPSSVTALARIMVRDRQFAPGPILTTNFDPLIEIAIRRAGGVAVTHYWDADGHLEGVDVPEGILVVHLHGYWRLGDTLHAPIQLLQKREALQAALERLLEQRAVLVTGYGGWDDVFTAALADAVRRHRHGDLDVLWTFYQSDDAEIRVRYARLAEAVGFVPGRISFYKGVDCHSLLASLDQDGSPPSSQAEDTAPALPDDFSSPIEGLVALSRSALLAQPVLTEPSQLLRYFDGQVPTWAQALSPVVPRLAATDDVIRDVGLDYEIDSVALHLVLGPAGEGKSTLAHQVAAHFARTAPTWRVLWRDPAGPSPHFALERLQEGDWRWLLVLDDADTAVASLQAALATFYGSDRRDLSLVLVARDSDWNASGAATWPWAEYSRVTRHRVRGLTDGDARAVVDAWAKAGTLGLGRLAAEPDGTRRASLLRKAAAGEAEDAALSGEGSFLGAMLRVRFGDSIEDHVRELMRRLAARVSVNGIPALRPFLYVAAVHAENILSLPPEVVAEALHVSPGRLYSEVLWPLGEEAAVTQAGAAVVVRHRALAEAAVRLAADFQEDIGECYYDIIRATVRVRRAQQYVPDMAAILYVSTRLLDTSPRIAVRAARAPVDEEMNRMSYRVNLCKVLSGAGRPAESVQVAADAFRARRSMFDVQEVLRGLVFQWGIVYRETGRPAANAVLAGLSLADLALAEPVDAARARASLNGLVRAFEAAHRKYGEQRLSDAMHAARELLGILGGPSETSREKAAAGFEAVRRGLAVAYDHVEDDMIGREIGGSHSWSFRDAGTLFGQ